MRAQVCYLVFFLTVNFFSYYLYNPTPPDMEQPWMYAAGVVANMRILEDLAKISHGLGYKDYHVFKQNAVAALGSVIAAAHSTSDIDNDVTVTSDVFDGVPVRIYRSSSDKSRRGALVYLHGGGFSWGTPESYDGLLRRLVRDADIIVVGVYYRLAPQHPSPAGLEDCMRAARYVFVEAAALGVDPSRIGVAGDSAGGTLAASLAISFRDIENAPHFAYVATIYPWLQALDFNTPAMQQNERYVFPDLTRRGLATFALNYINASLDHIDTLITNRHVRPVAAAHFGHHIRPSNLPVDILGDEYTPPDLEHVADDPELIEMEAAILDPLNFPLMMDSLAGLPPMFVATMGYDTIRDDGFWFVRRLQKDRCSVKHYHDPIGWHGIINMIGGFVEFDAAQRLYTELLSFIQIFS